MKSTEFALIMFFTERIPMKSILAVTALSFVLVACASVPPSRPELVAISELEPGWARMFVTAGVLDNSPFSVDLKFSTNTGPVFVDGVRVGSTAYREYIAIDVRPGIRQVYWEPAEKVAGDKFCIENTPISMHEGETRYFAGDQSVEIGARFGLIGALASTCLAKPQINERALPAGSKLVSYYKFPSDGGSPDLDRSLTSIKAEALLSDRAKEPTPTIHATPPNAVQRLENLNELKVKGLISPADYEQKKKEILSTM